MFLEIEKEYLDPGNCRLPFVLCTIGKHRIQNPVSRPAGFVYHHMLWVEEGRGRFTVEESSFVLSRGEGLFCKREIPHSYQRDGDHFQTVWITFLCMDEILEYYRLPDWFRFKVTPYLRGITEELDALCMGNSTILSRSAAGYSWLADWLARQNEPYASTPSMVRQYLENHFAEPLTLDSVAAHVHRDKYALCHAYKEENGIPIMEQLKRIRIAKAKQLLRYSQYPVGEIGAMCGYESASYFGKLFREQTGQSPKEYRMRYGG